MWPTLYHCCRHEIKEIKINNNNNNNTIIIISNLLYHTNFKSKLITFSKILIISLHQLLVQMRTRPCSPTPQPSEKSYNIATEKRKHPVEKISFSLDSAIVCLLSQNQNKGVHMRVVYLERSKCRSKRKPTVLYLETAGGLKLSLWRCIEE